MNGAMRMGQKTPLLHLEQESALLREDFASQHKKKRLCNKYTFDEMIGEAFDLQCPRQMTSFNPQAHCSKQISAWHGSQLQAYPS
jgi:hypothetical protein